MKNLLKTILCVAGGASVGAIVDHFTGNKNTAEETNETTAGQEAAAPAPEKAPDKPEVKEK